ncbi:MAG: hypothetical protein ACREP2_11900 [Rhodanobacteraceae bacterium]
MNHQMNRLSLAVRVGLTAGLIAAAGLAQAQQPPESSAQTQGKPKTLQTLVVTGSLIRRVDTETASPVTIIDRQNITSSGIRGKKALAKQIFVSSRMPALARG